MKIALCLHPRSAIPGGLGCRAGGGINIHAALAGAGPLFLERVERDKFSVLSYSE